MDRGGERRVDELGPGEDLERPRLERRRPGLAVWLTLPLDDARRHAVARQLGRGEEARRSGPDHHHASLTHWPFNPASPSVRQFSRRVILYGGSRAQADRGGRASALPGPRCLIRRHGALAPRGAATPPRPEVAAAACAGPLRARGPQRFAALSVGARAAARRRASVRGQGRPRVDRGTGLEAPRLTALNMLAALAAELGDIGRVRRVVKLLGMVNCTEDFTRLRS
jgi:hypothetical protein